VGLLTGHCPEKNYALVCQTSLCAAFNRDSPDAKVGTAKHESGTFPSCPLPTASFKSGQETKTSYWTERGDGMLLFKADSPEAAESIIGQHPLIENGCVEYELHEWRIVVE
jgi:hypothetical protein